MHNNLYYKYINKLIKDDAIPSYVYFFPCFYGSLLWVYSWV